VIVGTAARRCRALAAGTFVVVAVTAFMGVAGPARAVPLPTTSGTTMQLVDQTTWVGDNSSFVLRFAVTTASPADVRAQISIYDRLQTRSDFVASLDGKVRAVVRRFNAVDLTTLGSPAGPFQVAIPVNPKTTRPGPDVLRLTNPGVYPVQVALYDAQGKSLSQMTTHLVFTGPNSRVATPLDVAWVVPIHVAPLVAPGGKETKLPGDTVQAFADLAAGMNDHPAVPLTLAVSGQTLDALSQSNDGGRVNAALAQAAGEPARQTIAGTYARTQLPALVPTLDAELTAQLARGRDAAQTLLRTAPVSNAWVEPGPLNTSSIDALVDRGLTHLVVNDRDVTPSASTFTPTQPFVLSGHAGRRITAVTADRGLGAHFAPGADPVLAGHQLLADLIMIQQELPSQARGVVIVPPDDWLPTVGLVKTVLDGLSTNALLRLSDIPTIQATRRRLQALEQLMPADTPMLKEVDRALLVGESSDLPDRLRTASVTEAGRLVEGTKEIFRLPGNRTVTLTARQGEIPLTILSSASTPARVRIRLSSQKLGFRPIGGTGGACQVAGSSETCTFDLRNQNTILKVPVVAKTAGVFSVRIDLESPDGTLNIATSTYTVRSTAASGVGVILTVGAALLLLMWWARDLRHGRRARRLVPSDVDDDVLPDDTGPSERPQLALHCRRTGGGLKAVSTGPPSPVTPKPYRGPQHFAGRTPGSLFSSAGEDDMPGSFARNTTVMAAGTVLSRLTGFGRILALVWAFHLTRLADVFNIANTVPNILYDLVVGGVLSATLVPVFVDYLGRDDKEETWRAISAVMTVIAAVLAVLTAIFWLIAPALIHLYVILNNTSTAPDQRAVGTTLLRLFAPQLFFLGGIAVTTAFLNARRHFVAPAFSPVVNNLIAIAALIATRLVASSLGLGSFRHDHWALLLLGLGTTAGYVVQFVLQVPPMFRGRRKPRLRPVWDPSHPAVRTILRLSAWTFGSVIANQVALNVILVLAARKAGDVTVFQTAFTFFQLPYAIFAVSIASVITPDLSARWSAGDVAGFRRQMARGLRLTLAILIPASVGYVLLAHPLIELVFRHGSFGAHDAHKIGTVVALFAVGLPGFSAYLLLMRGYQAMQDTRAMFRLYVVENAVTLVLAAALYPILGVGGLALGWVAAYTVGTIVAFAALRLRTRGLDGFETISVLARVGLASAVMAGAVWAVRAGLGGPSDTHLAAEVIVGATAGAVAYFAASRVLGIREWEGVLLRRRATV
jgi:putative peptidoglycan lipid II flippase